MIPFDAWLKSFGFARNPFETTEAGKEAQYAIDFLHETFVKPDGFDDILGYPLHPKSSLVFAARGKGKTSARLMTAHFCREGIFPKEMGIKGSKTIRVLPVHHTRFERLVGANSPSALVDSHVIEILLRAVPSMVDMLVHYPEIIEWIDKLDALRRLEIQYFLVAFSSYLTFQEYKIARDLFGNEITNLDESRTPIGFSLPTSSQQKIGLSAQEIKSHLAAYSQIPPIDLLGRFATLMVDLGFGSVYILVDGSDEIPETADNFVAAAGLLIPLLANLNLMTNTPYLGFKIFVPSEMETLLLDATKKVRQDRLAVQRIELREDDLVEILHRRLAYCSDGVISSMNAIASVDVRGQIEKELVIRAEGNPRNLVLLGQYMLEHRCHVLGVNEKQEEYLLNSNDLTWALRKLWGEPSQTNVTNVSVEAPISIQSNATPQPVATPISGDWVRHELPAPIALSYLVYQRESVAHIRIWKMYDLVEASLAFLSQVLLALLRQKLNEATSLQLKKTGLRLERTSMGQWRTAAEKLPGMLAGLKIDSYFARACQRVVKKNSDFIQAINSERNRSAHGGPQSEKVCENLIDQYTHPLQQYLTDLNFLRENRLIKVLNVDKRENNYLHRCTSYVGDAVVFPALNVELSTPLDSECLWFLDGDDPVNLYPLMLVTLREQLGEEFWLFQGLTKNAVIYKNYGVGKTIEKRDQFGVMEKIMVS